MKPGFPVVASIIFSALGAWSPADGQTHSAHMRRIPANRDTVARAARGVLAEAGFTLEDRPKAGTVGKARIAYASLPCEHVRGASGQWVLQINLNPRLGRVGKDTTAMMVSFEETQPVLDARRAEGVSTFEFDCLQRYLNQLVDSIAARALVRE